MFILTNSFLICNLMEMKAVSFIFIEVQVFILETNDTVIFTSYHYKEKLRLMIWIALFQRMFWSHAMFYSCFALHSCLSMMFNYSWRSCHFPWYEVHCFVNRISCWTWHYLVFSTLTFKYEILLQGHLLFVDHLNEINCFTFPLMYLTKISTLRVLF